MGTGRSHFRQSLAHQGQTLDRRETPLRGRICRYSNAFVHGPQHFRSADPPHFWSPPAFDPSDEFSLLQEEADEFGIEVGTLPPVERITFDYIRSPIGRIANGVRGSPIAGSGTLSTRAVFS